jgi:putative DNA methylase
MAIPRKKLIEVALPLEPINREAAREKSIRHGHPSTLHLWWARRPLAACRAVLFGQFVDDPSAWPERFPTEEAQAAERDRLHKLIERLVRWEASNNEAILNEARWEIARSIAWNRGEEPPANDDPARVFDYLQSKAPPVYDPFCGGGAIPLEAQRLGLRAYGSDLNPVAVLISKALVEIPPKFADLSPVNPESRAKIAAGGRWQGKRAQGLAEDVRYYGRCVRDEAFKRIGHLYPYATLPDGSKGTVIAWLWARTVASPNPAANGAYVPLVSSFVLSTKEGKKAWVEPLIDPNSPDGWRFEVRSGSLSRTEQERLKAGTKTGRGEFTCLLTGATIDGDYLRERGKSGGLSTRLMAVFVDTGRGKLALSPDATQEKCAASAEPQWVPDGEMFKGALGFRVPNYGITEWSGLFTRRQLTSLATFADLVDEIGPRIARDAIRSGAQAEYAKAVQTYLGFAISRVADLNCTGCTWLPDLLAIAHIFARQAVSMTWDFAECNPVEDKWEGACEWIARVLEVLPAMGFGQISQLPAQRDRYPLKDAVFFSDPPYYDNIGYADLSDFFYMWLRKALRNCWPDIFRTLQTPKDDELVATPSRHGGREGAEAFFLSGMKKTFNAIAAVIVPSVPFPLFYAFKQANLTEDGVVSTGWATFLEAIRLSGFIIDGTWPIRTERSVRTRGIGSNALASSIVLVCRKQEPEAAVTTRAAFLRDLKRELPSALKLLQAESIAPVDLTQASIGPGMAIFSRYAKVLNADDSEMTVKAALQDINSALDAFLSEQEAEYDPYTRFAITWFEQSGMASGPYGTAEILATARGISVGGVDDAGIVESGGGKVRLKRREEMREGRDDDNGTVWGATQHLIHRLMGENGSEESAAGVLAGLGHRAEAAKDLAYRLYSICERKKWAEEGYAYNALVASWPRLVERAKTFASGPAQPNLAL